MLEAWSLSRGGGGDTIQLGGLGRALFARDPSCSIPEGTDYSKDTIQLTLEQAAQPTALSDRMQAAIPTTMLHDERLIVTVERSALPRLPYMEGAALPKAGA